MNTTSTKPNVWFWVIGIVALLWNLAGCSQFFQQAMNSESWRANFTPEMLEIIDKLPLWYIVVFAVAVIASTIACILLLMRRKLAVPFFLVGLIAVAIQSFYNGFINEARETYNMPQYIITAILPIFSFVLLYYARRADKLSWLK